MCHCDVRVYYVSLLISIVSLAGHEVVGQVSLRHVYEIAAIKARDPAFAGVPLESVCRTIVGSAKSLGVEVIDGR